MLCRGNILRRRAVEWSCTMAQAAPFLEYNRREVLFRESVMAFMGVKEEEAAAPVALEPEAQAAAIKGILNRAARK